VRRDLPDGLSGDLPVQTLLQKDFCFLLTQINPELRGPVPTEGRIAIVTDVGWDAVDAAASGGLVKQRADEWRFRGRRSRVVLTPRCWRQVRGFFRATTVARKPGHRGEHEGNR
jgi:hypothetical protein